MYILAAYVVTIRIKLHMQVISAMASQGLRTIGVAYKDLNEKEAQMVRFVSSSRIKQMATGASNYIM